MIHTTSTREPEKFWEHIKAKASANIGSASKDAGPESEDQVKCHNSRSCILRNPVNLSSRDSCI